MAGYTLQFPAGTEVRVPFIVPQSGGWLGTTRIRLATIDSNILIHEMLFIRPNGGDGRRYYTRVGSQANNYYETSNPHRAQFLRYMMQYESMVNLTYTASNPVTVVVETSRTHRTRLWTPLTGLAEWNKKNDPKPWETNTSMPNSTEQENSLTPQIYRGTRYWIAV